MIEYQDTDSHFCYVVMLQDIADCQCFHSFLPQGLFYDLETPYGYGGPLSDAEISEKSQQLFLQEMKCYCKEKRIVSQFIRFHPLLGNYSQMHKIIDSLYLKDSIYIDTTSPEIILSNMDSKNRNMVRKAIKNGITIKHVPIECYREFVPIYAETMIRDHASNYYMFKEDYFHSQLLLSDNACIFYALYEGNPVSGAIVYYNDRYMHYHLAGSKIEYRKYAPGNLLLYEAACWACKRGISKFHLGGGLSANDSLFGFKKQFNKFGRLPYFIGRTIFQPDMYNELLSLREKYDSNFDINNNRMIQYRYEQK